MTGGKLGELPDHVALIQAARYLGVAPWDLMERPTVWVTWALQDERVDIEAKNEMIKQARGGGGMFGHLGA